MKKLFFLMTAAILVCSVSLISSCTKDDNPVNTGTKVCKSYKVEYAFSNPLTNKDFFSAKYAYWSNGVKHGPIGVYGNSVSQAYEVISKEITFPAEESFFLHFTPTKEDESATATLESKGELIITTYDLRKNVLDTKKHEWSVYHSSAGSKEQLELSAQSSYVEANVKIESDGTITITDNDQDEASSKSGIEW